MLSAPPQHTCPHAPPFPRPCLADPNRLEGLSLKEQAKLRAAYAAIDENVYDGTIRCKAIPRLSFLNSLLPDCTEAGQVAPRLSVSPLHDSVVRGVDGL